MFIENFLRENLRKEYERKTKAKKKHQYTKKHNDKRTRYILSNPISDVFQ